MCVEAAFPGFEIENRTGQAGVAGEEPFAPLRMGGECAGGEVAGEILGHEEAGLLGALPDLGLIERRQSGEAVAEAAGVLLGDGERPAAALIATGAASEPIAGPLARFGESSVDSGQHANFRTRIVWRDHQSRVLEILSIFSIFALLYVVAAYGWLRDGLRNRRRAQILDGALPALLGQDIRRARELLGEPSKIEFGMSGRRLYIWRPPLWLALPETATLTVVILTVEANDMVSETSWKAD